MVITVKFSSFSKGFFECGYCLLHIAICFMCFGKVSECDEMFHVPIQVKTLSVLK